MESIRQRDYTFVTNNRSDFLVRFCPDSCRKVEGVFS
jgi:hypothetical protein